MKCDRCDSEATVHEITVRQGAKVERHLCEACARKEGLAPPGGLPVTELTIAHIIAPGGAAAKPRPGPAVRAQACPTCGLAYTEFRKSGLLGCPDCYRAFETQLAPLIERAHAGATHHVGKLPRRKLAASRLANADPGVLGSPEEQRERLAALRRQLADAVRGEQYERAARIRDELRRLEHPGGAEQGGGGMPPEGSGPPARRPA